MELLRAKEVDKAASALEYLYARKTIEKKIAQLQLKLERSVPAKYDDISNPLNVCGIHLALLRQFCGVTYLVVYASQIPLHD